MCRVAGQSQGGVCGNRTSPIHDVSNPTRRDAEAQRQSVGAQAAGFQLAPEKPAGMCDRRHALPPVVVEDFNLVRVTVSEFETDSPAIVDGHGPLPPTITSQLVETHAPQGTDVAERGGDVQCKQQVDSCLEVKTAKPVRFLPFPNFASGGSVP